VVIGTDWIGNGKSNYHAIRARSDKMGTNCKNNTLMEQFYNLIAKS
jgi:hypothetical protein